MEGVLLYASALSLAYLAFTSIGKKTFLAVDIVYRLMIGILIIEMMTMWLFSTENISYFPHLMRVNSPITFLLAPSFFLYVHFRVSTRKKFVGADLLHVIPAVFMLIYLMSFYVLPADEKLTLYYQWKSGYRVDRLPVEWIYRIQQLVYTLWIISLMYDHRRKLGPTASLVSISYILIWGIDFFRFLSPARETANLVWIHIMTFLPFLIFFELKFQKVGGKKYSTSGLGDAKSAELAKRTEQLLRQERLFTNPKLVIADVAKMLEVHHNYVSQSVNSVFLKSFNDLINSMRVEEARNLLADKSNNNLTLEAISQMAGFNSISSFNAYFKKNEGITPSHYKKMIQQ